MVKRWSKMDTFMKVAVSMVLLWIIGTCIIVLGHKATGCVLIWSAVVIDVIAVMVVWYKSWRKRSIKNETNIQN